jgi:hypothetical protein
VIRSNSKAIDDASSCLASPSINLMACPELTPGRGAPLIAADVYML